MYKEFEKQLKEASKIMESANEDMKRLIHSSAKMINHLACCGFSIDEIIHFIDSIDEKQVLQRI
jgi:methyl-accepting chemotaxis protein